MQTMWICLATDILPEVDDVEGSVAGVMVGSVVDSGLLLGRQQDWIKCR